MEFVEFFTEMHWSVILLLVITIILFVIEIIIPGFGIWGIMGTITGIAAIVCEAVFTLSVFDVFFMIFLILVLFAILFVIFSHSFHKGLIKKTPLVESQTALPENYGINPNLKELVGKQGEIITLCKPVGKAKIDKSVYTVCSVKGAIYEGEKIKVVEVENNTIKVEKIGGEQDE